MERLPLREGFDLGVYVSLVAAVIVVPVGIALRSWEVPLLAFVAIMAVCVVGRSILPSAGAAVVAWCAGVALAAGLIAFGVWGIATFEPHCVSSPMYECFDTVGEQRADAVRFAMLPIIGGAVLLIVLVVAGVRRVLDAKVRRPNRTRSSL